MKRIEKLLKEIEGGPNSAFAVQNYETPDYTDIDSVTKDADEQGAARAFVPDDENDESFGVIDKDVRVLTGQRVDLSNSESPSAKYISKILKKDQD